MKALVYTGPEKLTYGDVPDPVPGVGEAIVRVAHVGICGSDMHAYLGHDERRPAPLILGHEAAGIVEAGRLKETRVVVNPLVSCGTCIACGAGRENLCPDRQIISMPPREGAFAELFAIPESNLITVPEIVPLEKAVLVEPIACGWHAVRLGREALGEPADEISALVLGGGAIGLGAALCLNVQGIPDVTIVEPNTMRRRFLQRNCAQQVMDPAELDADRFFDLVIDAVGLATTRNQASAQIRPGGVIMHIGLGEPDGGLNFRRVTLQEITFIGTYTYTSKDFNETAQAVFDGRLGTLDWTESRPLADGNSAFDDISSGVCEVPKIILKP